MRADVTALIEAAYLHHQVVGQWRPIAEELLDARFDGIAGRDELLAALPPT